MQHRNGGIQRASNSRIVYAKAMWSLLICIIISLQFSQAIGEGGVSCSATALDLFVYVSHKFNFSDFENKSLLLWGEKNICYSSSGPNIYLDDQTKQNRALAFPHQRLAYLRTSDYDFFYSSKGEIYAHIYFCRSDLQPNPNSQNFDQLRIYKRYELTNFREKNLESRRINLFQSLMGRDPEHANHKPNKNGRDTSIQVARRYWKPSISIHLVTNVPPFSRKDIPQYLRQHGYFFDRNGNLFSPVYINEFWIQFDDLVLLDSSVENVSLLLKFSEIDYYSWYLQTQFESSWSVQFNELQYGIDKYDDTKNRILQTDPKLLLLTFVITILHTIFDFLAFKNDFQFWRNKKSAVGLSVKSICVSSFSQIVVILYLVDNNTAKLILYSNVVAVIIEFWKLSKLISMEFVPIKTYFINGTIQVPVVRIGMRGDDEYIQSNTREYENFAFQHLSHVFYPILFGYATYSFVYVKHKNYYSWCISTIAGFIYAFGFIVMTPQLFINYKLKSVAHLPWRKLIYKFLNTFIDDLFAYIMKVPTMHRLACLRDDVVFFIYIYQSCIYSVDRKRPNEYETE